MSTRCNIKIVQADAEGHIDHKCAPIWLYHHHDGYPEGVGRELTKVAEQMFYRACDYANRLMRMDEPIYSDANTKMNEFEITRGQHGDIDYLYEVTVPYPASGSFGKQNVIVRCFKRAWRRSDHIFTEVEIPAKADWETEEAK